MITTLLLDLDGTLTEPADGITRSIRYALDKLGHPTDADLRWCIGPPLRITFPTLLGTTDPVVIERAVDLYRERYSHQGLYECTLYPGVAETVPLLASSHRLFLATAKPTVYATRLIEHFGLRAHFAGIYGPELSGRFDDKTELVAHLLAAERLDPAATLMIGDRDTDILAATRNGVRAFGATWGYGSPEELRAAGATALVPSMSAVPGALAALS